MKKEWEQIHPSKNQHLSVWNSGSTNDGSLLYSKEGWVDEANGIMRLPGSELGDSYSDDLLWSSPAYDLAYFSFTFSGKKKIVYPIDITYPLFFVFLFEGMRYFLGPMAFSLRRKLFKLSSKAQILPKKRSASWHVGLKSISRWL